MSYGRHGRRDMANLISQFLFSSSNPSLSFTIAVQGKNSLPKLVDGRKEQHFSFGVFCVL